MSPLDPAPGGTDIYQLASGRILKQIEWGCAATVLLSAVPVTLIMWPDTFFSYFYMQEIDHLHTKKRGPWFSPAQQYALSGVVIGATVALWGVIHRINSNVVRSLRVLPGRTVAITNNHFLRPTTLAVPMDAILPPVASLGPERLLFDIHRLQVANPPQADMQSPGVLEFFLFATNSLPEDSAPNQEFRRLFGWEPEEA